MIWLFKLNHTYKHYLCKGEGRVTVEKITFKELRQKVAVYASAMRRLGVQIGDRVVGECVIYLILTVESHSVFHLYFSDSSFISLSVSKKKSSYCDL